MPMDDIKVTYAVRFRLPLGCFSLEASDSNESLTPGGGTSWDRIEESCLEGEEASCWGSKAAKEES